MLFTTPMIIVSTSISYNYLFNEIWKENNYHLIANKIIINFSNYRQYKNNVRQLIV